jgi:hypothetical protein
MKKAHYTGLDGKKFVVEYDENLPCKLCGQPVYEASMGGTDICPSCDCGRIRPKEMLPGDVMVIFQWYDHIRAYNDLDEFNRLCNLGIGDEVEIETGGKIHLGKIIEKTTEPGLWHGTH